MHFQTMHTPSRRLIYPIHIPTAVDPGFVHSLLQVLPQCWMDGSGQKGQGDGSTVHTDSTLREGDPMDSQAGFCDLMPTLTSAGAKAQLFPNFLAWTSPSELGRSRSTAAAPCPTSRSAVARPRPEAPPVIRATRPCEERNGERYAGQTTPTLSSATEAPLFSRLLRRRCDPRVFPLLQDRTWCLTPRPPTQSPHAHMLRRVDLHLPSPTAALPGLEKCDPFSQHPSLPP